jgi:sugar phosphate isomerase/epimerase
VTAILVQEQHLPGGSLEEKWDAARSYGYDGIELRGAGDLAFAARLPELLRAAAAGVPMPTVCVDMLHFIGDFDAERRRDARAQIRSQLSVIAELGGRGAMTPASYGMFSRRLPPFEPPRTPAEDRAVSLLEEVGLGSVRLGADTYHMNIEEADPAAALESAGPWLGHVQVSDSNRLEPGAGHVDWTAICASLKSIGYDGPVALESRLSGPAEDVLPRVPVLLRQYL